MIRKQPVLLGDLLPLYLRKQGLETPLYECRIKGLWPQIAVDAAGEAAEGHTGEAEVRGQTLFVRLPSPALRANLSMKRSELVRRINETIGTQLITEIHFS